MFGFIAQFVRRFWPGLLLAWIAVLGLLWWQAPSWDSVAEEGEFKFLPPGAPTRVGEKLMERAFPAQRRQSSVVLVVTRSDGTPLKDADKAFLTDTLKPRLQQLSVFSPSERNDGAGQTSGPLLLGVRTFADATLGSLLVSADGRATLVVVELTTEFLSSRNVAIVDGIEELLATLKREGATPQGLDVALTGSAAVGRDQLQAKRRSARNIHAWTIWLVVGLLLVVYRAPLLALIPLTTLFVAVEVTLKSTALLAQAGYLGVFGGQEIYTTVIVYGAGVDFSLFLLSRCREELNNGRGVVDAVETSIRRVGMAVAASATTLMFGIGMLCLMSFRKFQQAGFSIALGFFLMLLASLLLAPPLLLLAGRFAFWPLSPGGGGNARTPSGPKKRTLANALWEAIGAELRRRPGTWWMVTVLALLPFAVVGLRNYDRLSYGIVSGLPADAVSLRGTRKLTEYFPAGKTGAVTLLLRNDNIDFASGRGESAVQSLTEDLWTHRDELHIADVRSLGKPRGFLVSSTDDSGEGAGGGSVVAKLLRRSTERRLAREHYVSSVESLDGHVTRATITLTTDPFSRGTIDHLDRLKSAVEESLPEALAGSTVYLLGATANLRDLKSVATRDRTQITLLVTAVVLLILVVLLRRVAVPVYLIVTVLFSFLATIGVTFLVFEAWEGDRFAGLDWTVPIFLFTVLIAVGEDYNIFLVTRADEEQHRHGPLRGIIEALSRTGGIISGCGVIMSGTFTSLVVGGELAGMRQLGFALAFGVLLDTFVVRTILVPAWLVLVNDGRFGRLSKWLGGRTGPAASPDSQSRTEN